MQHETEPKGNFDWWDLLPWIDWTVEEDDYEQEPVDDDLEF